MPLSTSHTCLNSCCLSQLFMPFSKVHTSLNNSYLTQPFRLSQQLIPLSTVHSSLSSSYLSQQFRLLSAVPISLKNAVFSQQFISLSTVHISHIHTKISYFELCLSESVINVTYSICMPESRTRSQTTYVKSEPFTLVNKNMKLKQRVVVIQWETKPWEPRGLVGSFMPPPGLSTTLCASSFH
jgi:hypothetical protein